MRSGSKPDPTIGTCSEFGMIRFKFSLDPGLLWFSKMDTQRRDQILQVLR